MSSGPLVGRAVVVTGATRGIGRGIAERLREAGASLVLGGRDRDELERIAAELGAGGVATVVGSVAEDAVAARLVEVCVERFGAIDGLVSNAGIVRDRTLMNMEPSELDDVVAVNLRGTWSCGRHAARAMRDRGGWILNVASSAAFHGSVGQSNYAASKAGVIGLSRAWSFELARYGIRVNALCPFAHTAMSDVHVARMFARASARGEPAPTARDLGLGDPGELGAIAVALAAADTVTGQVISFDGRRVALWSHPRETAEMRSDSAWAPAELARVLSDGTLAHEPMHPPALGA